MMTVAWVVAVEEGYHLKASVVAGAAFEGDSRQRAWEDYHQLEEMGIHQRVWEGYHQLEEANRPQEVSAVDHFEGEESLREV